MNTKIYFLKSLLIVLVIFLNLIKASGQCTTLVLQPNAANGADAEISNASPSANYGSVNEFDPLSWTISQSAYINRCLIRFDLSSIPSNAIIQQAVLTMYNNPNSGNTGGSHSTFSGSNAAWLQKITATWNESTVTWNNQPPTTTFNQVSIPQSTSGHQDYDINVLNLVQDIVSNPSSNFGWMIKMQNETPYRSLVFASSDDPDPANWPKLSVSYTVNNFLPSIISTGGTELCPGSSTVLHASPTGPTYSYQWLKNGSPISGAVSQDYSANTSGAYSCVVSNPCISKTSNSIILNSITPPGSVTTINIQPNGANGVDAEVSSYSGSVNSNFGSQPDFDPLAWTINSSPNNKRCFIRFDLSFIPSEAIVQQATLTLYNNPASTDANLGSHYYAQGSNAAWLQRVTAPWSENTITWNTQPATTTVNQVALPQSTSAHQDYLVDVTTFVQDEVNNPATNYGMMLRLQTESAYRALIFASSDNADSTKWPMLSISYKSPFTTSISAGGNTALCPGENVFLYASPAGPDNTFQWRMNGSAIPGETLPYYSATAAGTYNCIVSNQCASDTSKNISVTSRINADSIGTLVLQPDAANGMDAEVSSYSTTVNTNYGSIPDFDPLVWTISSTEYITRCFIRFDLSPIPVNATVTQSTLSLFNNPTSTDASGSSHSTASGSNAAWLQKVTAPWNENTITWNNQPATTTTNRVTVPQSTDVHQDYNLDVKSFVQDMVTNPALNYGMMLRLQTEIHYRSLVFASSDYSNSSKRPKLSVTYTLPTSCPTFLKLRVFLEGLYTGNLSMRPSIDPINLPFVCDSMTVELHDTVSPYDLVESSHGLIDIYGNGNFSFSSARLGHSYYVVLRHRSSVETWYRDIITFTSPSVGIDMIGQ